VDFEEQAGRQGTELAEPAGPAAGEILPDLAGRGPFHVVHAAVGAAAHLSVRRKQVIRHPRFDLASVILVLEGHKTVAGQGAPVLARAGEFMLVPPGGEAEVVNAPAPGGLYRAAIIGFAPELVADFAGHHRALIAGKRVLGRITSLSADAELAAALGRALRGLKGETTAGPDLLRHRLTEILVQLAERGLVLGGARAASLAERVGAHVGQDLAHPWTVAEVARALALGEATLRRHLAAEGTRFGDILAGARLGYALLLLQSSERSVVQIAQDVGYRSPSRFAARFRDHFGVAPSALR